MARRPTSGRLLPTQMALHATFADLLLMPAATLPLALWPAACPPCSHPNVLQSYAVRCCRLETHDVPRRTSYMLTLQLQLAQASKDQQAATQQRALDLPDPRRPGPEARVLQELNQVLDLQGSPLQPPMLLMPPGGGAPGPQPPAQQQQEQETHSGGLPQPAGACGDDDTAFHAACAPAADAADAAAVAAADDAFSAERAPLAEAEQLVLDLAAHAAPPGSLPGHLVIAAAMAAAGHKGSFNSGEGFGDPYGSSTQRGRPGQPPALGLRHVLVALGAQAGQFVSAHIMELADKVRRALPTYKGSAVGHPTPATSPPLPYPHSPPLRTASSSSRIPQCHNNNTSITPAPARPRPPPRPESRARFTTLCTATSSGQTSSGRGAWRCGRSCARRARWPPAWATCTRAWSCTGTSRPATSSCATPRSTAGASQQRCAWGQRRERGTEEARAATRLRCRACLLTSPVLPGRPACSECLAAAGC